MSESAGSIKHTLNQGNGSFICNQLSATEPLFQPIAPADNSRQSDQLRIDTSFTRSQKKCQQQFNGYSAPGIGNKLCFIDYDQPNLIEYARNGNHQIQKHLVREEAEIVFAAHQSVYLIRVI